MLNFLARATHFELFSLNSTLYMLIRGAIIYFLGVVLACFNKKLLGIRTPFNFILFVMLGSLCAAAILEEGNFLAAIITITFLILLNGSMTMLSFYFPTIENLIKGNPSILVKDGQIQWAEMKKNFITEREVYNQLHAQMHGHDLKDIKLAILESDGSISFIK